MKKIFAILVLAFTFNACKKEQGNPGKQEPGQPENQLKKPPPPPPNANPAFAFKDGYQVNGNRSVPAIFVMDVTGANKTKVFASYTNQTTDTPDFPAWSPDGTKLCFTLNSADLYTLNIALVNGVPTSSGATRIADGVAAGGSYKQGKWRPGANQIACVWKKTGDPDKIRMLPSAGGSPSDLYVTASTDWVIEDDIAFKSDGSNLVFSERQLSTGNVFLKVLDVSTSQVIKSINLSQYKSVREMDWGKSSGSNTVAITTVPLCDTSRIGNSGIHQLFTIDVSSAAPTLTWLFNDAGNISFSPNDFQTTVNSAGSRLCGGTGCCISSYFGIGILTIATKTYYSFPTNCSCSGGNHHDWKR